jgi:hypothetical protein
MRCILPGRSERQAGHYPFLPPDSPEQDRIIRAQARLNPTLSELHRQAAREMAAEKAEAEQ